MTTDELREEYNKPIHFNCKDGDESFTDEYVLWLEKQIMEYHEALQLVGNLVLKFVKNVIPIIFIINFVMLI